MYKCETHEINEEEYLRITAKRIECPIEDIKEVHDQYDAHIMNYYVHDDVTVFITLQEFYETLYVGFECVQEKKKSTFCNHLLQI